MKLFGKILFGKTAKIVKVKDFDEYAVEVTHYWFGKSFISYHAISSEHIPYETFGRNSFMFKSTCLGNYQRALKIYNEYYDKFDEVKL